MAHSKYGGLLTTVLLVVTNLLIPVAILVFAIGFFPYKPFLPGLAQFEHLQYGPPPEAPFDKLVFMVVDALRSDFVYAQNSGFRYTQSLIRDGSAMPFTSNARSPTVTMPRIKAITTGSIPSFVDLILNFDEADTSSTLAAQDTWLAQLKAKDLGRLIMFGDDTWLKLFPDTFDTEDGTSSFFVSDFTEVDNNVTRNIADELRNDDWGLMVLHYLGLDHIGHKAGPRSPNMIPKQHEMDGIVRDIYEALETNEHLQSTLLVVCGDHGMNDAGNHGASSPGETSPALLFVSPKLKEISSGSESPILPKGDFDYYNMVEQSDIAPTIAALLGFPVPKNNLGAFIPDFLPFWPKASDKVQILLRNARQILNIVTAAFGPEAFDGGSESAGSADPCALTGDVNELACSWRRLNQEADIQANADDVDQAWLSATSEWLRKAQDLMSSMASNYDVPKLVGGFGLATGSTVLAVAATLLHSNVGNLIPFGLMTLLYGIMMFASSYVEEEQHFWYWSSTMWLAFLGVRNVRRSYWTTSSILTPLVSLTALRLIRSWTQTGQKFAGEPDIVKLFLHEHPALLWLLVGLTYALLSSRMLTSLEGGIPFVAATGLTALLVSTASTFKLAFAAEDAPELVVGLAKALSDNLQGQSLLLRARVVFALLGVGAGVAVYHAFTGGPRAGRTSAQLLHHLTTLLAITQSRVTNVPLLLLSSLVLRHLQALPLSVAEITTTSVLLQHAAFFAAGGSNAISSVDLSSAYNGIGDYNVVAVGLLTLVSNWAGPIFWTSATNLLLLRKFFADGERAKREEKQARAADVWRAHVALLTVFAAASVAFVMAACTALRTHLFIWTVFSPKYLYCIAWNLGQHLLINVGFGGLLFWLGAR